MTGPLRRLACVAALVLCAAQAPAQTAGLETVQVAAAAGEAEAQFQLAEIYRRGLGLPQNYARAADWYRAAAEQDHAGALNGLAGLYAGGLGVERDPARAFALVSQAAASGAPEYLHSLAVAHETGLGTDPDPVRAAELYRQAAAMGWQPSAVALGLLYQEGRGVAQDVPRAIELYTAPAEAGNARAQNNIGLIFARGEGGVERDYAKALHWLGRAAEQGLPAALRNLGAMYENGFGVDVDEARARRLYRLAALAPGETADADGDAAGPGLLFDPRLQAPDPALLPSYRLGAKAGDPVALFLLGYLRAETARDAADHRAAAQLFEDAAARGSAAAMANLGLMMFEGRGVLQDFVEGYKWLSLAAASGFPGAAAARDRLGRRMTPEQIDAANALAEAHWQARAENGLPRP